MSRRSVRIVNGRKNFEGLKQPSQKMSTDHPDHNKSLNLAA